MREREGGRERKKERERERERERRLRMILYYIVPNQNDHCRLIILCSFYLVTALISTEKSVPSFCSLEYSLELS